MYSHRLLKQISLIFVFKRGGPGSIQNQNMRDSWWTKWHCDRFSLEYFCFSLSVTFPQNSILNFIYVLLWPEEQTGEAWEPSKKLSFFFRKWGSMGYKNGYNFTFSVLKVIKAGESFIFVIHNFNCHRPSTSLGYFVLSRDNSNPQSKIISDNHNWTAIHKIADMTPVTTLCASSWHIS